MGGSFVIAANNAYSESPEALSTAFAFPPLKLHTGIPTPCWRERELTGQKDLKPSTQFPSSDRTCEILCSG